VTPVPVVHDLGHREPTLDPTRRRCGIQLQATQELPTLLVSVEASPMALAVNDPGNSVLLAVAFDPVRSLAAHPAIVRSGTDTEVGVKSTPNHPHHPQKDRCGGLNSLVDRSGRGAAWLARLTGG